LFYDNWIMQVLPQF